MLMMKAGVFRPAKLVSLRKIESKYSRHRRRRRRRLAHRRDDARSRALERSAEVRKHAPVITRTMRTLSNVRVRNVATVGGALAHGDPHMDLPPVLMALGAHARRSSGPRASASSRSRTCSPATTRPCWRRTN